MKIYSVEYTKQALKALEIIAKIEDDKILIMILDVDNRRQIYR